MLLAELDPSLRGEPRLESLDDGFSPRQDPLPRADEPVPDAEPAEPRLPEKSPF